MSQHWLNPDWIPNLCLPNISIDHLKNIGIKALVIDVDKTLLHDREVRLHDSVKNWIYEAKSLQTLHLLSNNPSKKRIKLIGDELDLEFSYSGGKPRKRKLEKI